MSYLDWHDEPGYYRDVTRHFRSDAAILDVGCGSGWLSDHFSDYTGVDASQQAVEAAAARGRSVQRIDVQAGLPFEDSRFDGAILKDLLEHVDDPASLLLEVGRVLKPGGRVFASSPDAQRWVWDDYTHKRPFTRKAFRLMFEDQGFDVETVSYETVVPGSAIISGYTRRKRRPRLLALLAWLPMLRRNVWLVASRPGSKKT